jgi:hypothetical protein
MFTRTFSVGRTRVLGRAVSLVLALGFVMGALSLAGCPMEDEEFVDDHKLNQNLIGSWIVSGDGWSDQFTITAGQTISHPSDFGGYMDYSNASIEYVYNFSETAGCLIIKRAANKYTAVYFSSLTATTVLLGNAYDTNKQYDATNPDAQDPAVDTLELAKERFKPKNADSYGGGSAQTGTPLIKQNNS